MKVIKLSIIILIFLLIPTVYAFDYNESLVDCWDYDGQSLVGELTHSLENNGFVLGDGMVQGQDAGDYLEELGNEGDFDLTGDYTLCSIFNITVSNHNNGLISKKNTTVDDHGVYGMWITADGGGNDINFRANDDQNDHGVQLNISTVYYACVVFYDDRYSKIYLDGVLGSQHDHGGNTATNNDNIVIGSFYDLDNSMYGTIYQSIVFNHDLNSSELDDMYNLGDYRNCSYIRGLPSGSSSPSMNILVNLVNNTQNYNFNFLEIYFNATLGDETTDLANCTVMVNDVPVDNLTNVNLTVNTLHNYTFGSVSQWFNFSVNCTNFESNDDSGKFYYNVDTITPVIKTDFVNNTVYNISDSIEIRVNFTDDNLFAYNVTVFKPDGSVFSTHQYYVENLTGGFASNVTIINPVSADIDNNYSIKFESWDSHTKVKIDNYLVEIFNDKVIYEDVILLSWNISDVKEFKTTKQVDRYDFELKFEDVGWSKLIVETEAKFKYLEYKGYPSFLDYENLKWIDFYSDNIGEWYIVKITDKKYVVYFYHDSKKVYFQSIGDLNYNQIGYKFSIKDDEDLTDSYLLSILEEEQLQTSDIDDIREAVDMIPVLMFYIFLTSVSFWLILHRENVLGVVGLFASFGLDMVLIGQFYDLWFPSMIATGVSALMITVGSLIVFFVLTFWKLGTIVWFSAKGINQKV